MIKSTPKKESSILSEKNGAQTKRKVSGREKVSQGEKVVSARKQPSAKTAAKEASEKTAKAAAKEASEKTAKEATEKLMKMGKVGTAVGIGAAVVAGLNKNKGRQSNSQLYGQKGY